MNGVEMTIDESALQPQKKRKLWLWILIGVLVVGGLGSALRGDKDDKPSQSGDQPAPVTFVEAGEKDTDTDRTPVSEPTPEPEPVADQKSGKADEPQKELTLSQRNAIRKAESYLEVLAFSESGLVKQLKFEGFSSSDAKFAVGQLDVDWKEQAVLKAEDYLDATAFSKKSLISQLKFEGFTSNQAKQAVERVEVDWNEQAALKAEQYLDYSSFSKKRLIEQLKFEGFTDKQAKFGVKAVGL